MNVRHLELFYHVVQHRGINRAVGRMPIPIQQPALSEQIKKLEQAAGALLFTRKKFRLTPKGHEVYQFIRPFFEELESLGPRLRDANPRYRIVADDIFIRRYAGAVLGEIRKKNREASFELVGGTGEAAIRLLREGDVDLAISALPTERLKGLVFLRIASRKLVLLVNRRSDLRTAAQLWSAQTLSAPLIVPDTTDGVARSFQRGLRRGGLRWTPRIAAHSVGSVGPCVAGGAGVGVSLGVSYVVKHPNVRVLPLAGFDPVSYCAAWRPESTVQMKPLLRAIRLCVEEGS
jgi:DNA-binding transcriptional LysR family regulator